MVKFYDSEARKGNLSCWLRGEVDPGKCERDSGYELYSVAKAAAPSSSHTPAAAPSAPSALSEQYPGHTPFYMCKFFGEQCDVANQTTANLTHAETKASVPNHTVANGLLPLSTQLDRDAQQSAQVGSSRLHTEGACLKVRDTNFDRWFSGPSSTRKAGAEDCRYSCTHDKHTWCVGYEFEATDGGTCKLFDDCTDTTGSQRPDGFEHSGQGVGRVASAPTASWHTTMAEHQREDADMVKPMTGSGSGGNQASELGFITGHQAGALNVGFRRHEDAAPAESVAESDRSPEAVIRYGQETLRLQKEAELWKLQKREAELNKTHGNRPPQGLNSLPFITLSDGVPEW